MAMKTNKGKEALFTEINITPLTDIFLVLLIIMMVVAPTFQSTDSSITIPEINSGISIEQKNATVSVTKDGKMYLNGTPVTDENLTNELVNLKPQLEKPELVVKADEGSRQVHDVDLEERDEEPQQDRIVLKERKAHDRGNQEEPRQHIALEDVSAEPVADHVDFPLSLPFVSPNSGQGAGSCLPAPLPFFCKRSL